MCESMQGNLTQNKNAIILEVHSGYVFTQEVIWSGCLWKILYFSLFALLSLTFFLPSWKRWFRESESESTQVACSEGGRVPQMGSTDAL